MPQTLAWNYITYKDHISINGVQEIAGSVWGYKENHLTISVPVSKSIF